MKIVLDVLVVLLRIAFLAILACTFKMDNALHALSCAILVQDQRFAIFVIMGIFLSLLPSLTMKLPSFNAFLAIIHARVALTQSMPASLALPTLRWWVRSA